MTVQLTIDIFSGRPNPILQIPLHHARELFSSLPRAKVGEPRSASFPRLGYRGLVVEHNEPAIADTLPAASRIYRGVLQHHDQTLAVGYGLERDLLAAGGFADKSGLPSDLRGYIATQMERTASEAPRFPVKKTSMAAESGPLVPGSERAPVFEPAWWNDGAAKQARNNCYNYSTNYRTDTFAQPGRASGFAISAIACDQVLPFAIADSLVNDPVNNNEFPAEGHLVALVTAPRFDFHWYRKGPDGMWSHKIGPQPVTDFDNAGAPIPDPRAADRGPYSDFCGFMVVLHGHIKLE